MVPLHLPPLSSAHVCITVWCSCDLQRAVPSRLFCGRNWIWSHWCHSTQRNIGLMPQLKPGKRGAVCCEQEDGAGWWHRQWARSQWSDKDLGLDKTALGATRRERKEQVSKEARPVGQGRCLLLCTWAPHPALWAAVWEGCVPAGASPVESHGNHQWYGTSVLWGRADRAMAAQPGKEKALGRPCLLVPKRGLSERWGQTFFQSWAHIHRTGPN